MLFKDEIIKYQNIKNDNKSLFDFSKLKQELKIRGYSNKTISAYVYHNQRFISHYKKSPLKITNQDVKNYIEYLIDKNLSRATIRLAHSSLLFYYTKILKKNLMVDIKAPKKDKKQIIILTKEEIDQLINNTKNQKHKLLIEMIYSSGLRVSEVVKLKFKDIINNEKLIHIRGAKGNKDRIVITSNKVLEKLRLLNYKNENDYIFSGRNGHLTIRSVQKIIKDAKKKSRLNKNVYPHLLRHSFATHLVNKDVDTKKIQKLLGHSSIRTTQRYLHISNQAIKNIKSPYDY